MEIKYKAKTSVYSIEKIEIESEIEKTITFKSKFHAKPCRENEETGYYSYFDTELQAYQFILDYSNRKIEGYNRNIAYEKEQINKFKQKHNL